MNSATQNSQPQPAASARYKVLLGAIIVQLILGTVYGYSIFWKPLASEIFPPVITEAQKAEMQAAGKNVGGMTVVADKAAADNQTKINQGYLKYAFSICILSFAAVMVIAGRVQDLKGPRFPAIVGAILMAMGFLFAGFMNSPIVFYIAHAAFAGVTTIVLLMLYHAIMGNVDLSQAPMRRSIPMGIVTAVIVAGVVLANEYVGKLGEWDKLFLLWGTVGFLAGAGIGFAYVCPIAALVKWFPQHKGLVSGLAVAGFGFGAYFFKGDPYIISADWFSVPIPGAQGFSKVFGIRTLFLVHGLVALVGISAGAMLLRNPPGVAKAAGAGADSTWQDTLRRPVFYVLWLMFFSGAMAGLMVIGIVQPFVADQLTAAKLDAAAALKIGAAAVGYLAIFNALGRVVWGLVSDRIGRTTAFVAMFTIQAVVMFTLGHLDTATALCVGAGAVGFNFGGNFALFPSATADLFGAKNLGANYGWVFTSYGIAGVVGIAAGNEAIKRTGSYAAAFTVAAVLCLLSAALAVALRFIPKPAPVPKLAS
jgi:OFA family oxalate/formate antiporter-like MFS transporter